MFWFNRNKKKEEIKKDESVPKSTKEKVEENIFSCKRNKNKLLDKRDELYKRINGTINSAYFVPASWWYKEFKHYAEIRSLEKNKLLTDEIKEKCNEIVYDYRNELKMIEVQIDHYDFLLTSYFKTLDRIYNSKNEFQLMLADLQKIKQLDLSESNLKEIKDDNDKLLIEELFQEEKHKDIKLEIENLKKDLDLFEEYIKELKKLK